MDQAQDWEGGDRSRLRWRRYAVVAAVLLAAVAAGTQLLVSEGDPGRLAVTPGGVVAPGRAAPWQPLEQRTGLSLLVARASGRLDLVDVDSGRTTARPLLRLGEGVDGPVLARTAGRAVAVAADGGVGSVDARGRGVRIDDDATAVIGASPVSAWLVARDAGGRSVRQVPDGAGGVVPEGEAPVPGGNRPVAAQGRLVLLETDVGLRWWNPASGDVVALPGARAVGVGPTVSLLCDGDCRTVDLRTWEGDRLGRVRTGEPVHTAAPSPDEQLVALLVATGEGPATLLLLDRRTEQVHTVVNGVRPEGRPALAWSDDGRWLCMVTADDRVGLYDTTTGRTHAVDVDAGDVEGLVVAPPRDTTTR